MKGITKYKGKLYKRAKRANIHKGSLIKLVCKRGSDYFKYNGIYEVVNEPYKLQDGRMSGAEIIIPKELRDSKYDLCLKCNYNIMPNEYFQLIEYIRPNNPITKYNEDLND